MKIQHSGPDSRTAKNSRARRRPLSPAAPDADPTPRAHRKEPEEQGKRPPRTAQDAGAHAARSALAYPLRPRQTQPRTFYPRAACSPLFPGMDCFARQGLTALPHILDEIMPLNAGRRRELPAACRELSALLTTDRADLSLPYWTTPRLTSAYLRYFLPWNLVRLLPLLPALPLALPELREEDERPLIIDLGSGPFTMPLALWLGRPDFRAAPFTLVCADTAPHPLHLGRDIFEALRRKLDPSSPWEVHALRAPLGQALRRLHGRPWLISVGNVLNELEEKSRRPGAWQDKITTFAEDAARILLPGGFLFGLEPGTRQGAKLIRALREAAMYGELGFTDPEDDIEEDIAGDSAGMRASGSQEFFSRDDSDEFPDGFPGGVTDEADPKSAAGAPRLVPLAPCPHTGTCPLNRPGNSAWCHVNAPASDAPDELRAISRRAGLDKDSVSLSFLLLRKIDEAEAERPTPRPGTLSARLLSEPFTLPDYPGRARYACTARGLALVPDCAMLPPGALCAVEDVPRPPRDRKSGALILPLARPESSSPLRPVPSEQGENRDGRSGAGLSRYGQVRRNGDDHKSTAPGQDKMSTPRRSTSRKKFPSPRTGGAGRQA